MSLENKLFRQQQREAGNPYKEETRSWLAWSRGYVDGQLAMVLKHFRSAKQKRQKPYSAASQGSTKENT